jgi:ethanolaminephosphotransferase
MLTGQITFLGLCFVFANVGTLFFLDPTYSGRELPSLVYLSWAIGLFAYQSEFGHRECRGETSG